MEGSKDSLESTSQGRDRLLAMLSTALGAKAAKYLYDDEVVEIMVNPDGKLWIDRLGAGRSFTGELMNPSDTERLIYIVASSVKTTCNRENPILSAELPSTGARFQGVLPPIVENPTVTIRKKALKIFSFDDYVRTGVMSEQQRELIVQAVKGRKNILVVGSTGSGKTTLVNAVLAEMANTNDRIIIIEDTRELQCAAEDVVYMRTKDDVSMTDLLKATMRLRPDRIVIGEVRGPEALALIKAWGTGHSGVGTAHAGSAREGLIRIEQLIQEAGVTASKHLIGDVIDVVIYIERTASGRIVKEISTVSWEGGDYRLDPI